jgi:hypothetical protein
MPYYFKIFELFLLATVKFFYTPIAAFILGLSLFEAMAVTIAGGLFGFVFFYNLSYFIILSVQYIKPHVRKIIPHHVKHRYRNWKLKNETKKLNRKKFTKKNRFIIKTKTTYGKWGIMLLTPVALSIPIGAFLLRKYYFKQPNTLFFALLVITIEGIILSLIFWLVPLDFIKN